MKRQGSVCPLPPCVPGPLGFVIVFLEQEGKSFICGSFLSPLNEMVGGSVACFYFMVFVLFLAALGVGNSV
jgi:hypothetical protein